MLLALLLTSGGFKLAAPAGPGLTAAVAILLLIAGVVLLALTRDPGTKLVSAVALLNVSGAFILSFWLAARWAQFSTSGRVVVGVTVAGLLLLAIAELVSTLPRFSGEDAE